MIVKLFSDMSIFVSIPTLHDKEIFSTIFSALKNSKTNVNIGVASMTDVEFYKNIKSTFKNNHNVKIKWFNPNENRGVGNGRNNAKSLYDGEDYFIQVDSHTLFEDSWDIKLLEMYNRSLDITKNKKTILTAYLGHYHSFGDTRFVGSKLSKYPIFTDKFFREYVSIKSWLALPISQFPEQFRLNLDFIPSNKFNACFAMGNSYFVNEYSLPRNIIFFEEEIIQTIELMKNKFSLCFPNQDLPITHFYEDDQIEDKRQSWLHMEENSIFYELESSRIFYDFIHNENNIDYCKKFEKYSGYSVYNTKSKPYHIPSNYVLD